MTLVSHRIKTGEAELVGVFGHWPFKQNHISSSKPAGPNQTLQPLNQITSLSIMSLFFLFCCPKSKPKSRTAKLFHCFPKQFSTLDCFPKQYFEAIQANLTAVEPLVCQCSNPPKQMMLFFESSHATHAKKNVHEVLLSQIVWIQTDDANLGGY